MTSPLTNPDLARFLRDHIDSTGENPKGAALADALGIARNNMSRNLTNLEESGHLDRSTTPWTIPATTRAILDAMDGKTPANADGNGPVRMIPLGQIIPSNFNPRRTFDEDNIAALANSISAQGLLQPLLVRSLGPDLNKGFETFQIIAGERRWMALNRITERAEQHTRPVPCHIRQLSDSDAIAAAISENLDRTDVPAIEQAEGFLAWLDARALAGEPHSTSDLAAKLGKTPRYVQQWVKLARRASPWLKANLRTGQISFDLARSITSHDHTIQDLVVTNVLDGKWKGAPDSVNDILKKLSTDLAFALFPIEDYDGPALRSGDKPTHAFDKQRFDALQLEALKAYEADGWKRHTLLPEEVGSPLTRLPDDFEGPCLKLYSYNASSGLVRFAKYSEAAPAQPAAEPASTDIVPASTSDEISEPEDEDDTPPTMDMFETAHAPGETHTLSLVTAAGEHIRYDLENAWAASAVPVHFPPFPTDHGSHPHVPEMVWLDAMDVAEAQFMDAAISDVSSEDPEDHLRRIFRASLTALSRHLIANGVRLTDNAVNLDDNPSTPIET